MNTKTINYFLSTLAAIVLLTCRIIHPYGFQGILSFDEITFDIIIILTLLLKGLKNNISKWLWFYFFYRYLNHLFYTRSIGAVFYPALWITLLYFIVFFEDIYLKQFIKYYKILALIVITFFYLQEFTFYTSGYRISGLIRGLPIYLNGVTDAKSYVDSLTYADRSASFFSEPAAFVQFLIPLLAILLFSDHQYKYKKGWIFLLIVTLLIARSGNGLVGMAILFLFYLYKILYKTSIRIKIISISSLCIIGFIALNLYIKSNVGEEMLERQTEVTEMDESSSGFWRIFRGYFVFDEYTPIQKIFGIDNYNIIEEKTLQSIVSAPNSHNNLYFNVMQSILLRTGYIGVFLFFMFIRSLWLKNDITGRAILMCFTAYMFLTSHYFTSTMIFYFTLAYKYQQQNKNIINSKKIKINNE